MTHLHHHFLPHKHPSTGSGQVHHRAHAISAAALFAYLQILVVASAGIYLVRLISPAILGTATFGAQEIIEITNKKRLENNLPPLSANTRLAQAAQAKASNMFLEDYWAHFAPSGKTPWFFISASGYKYLYAGENLARDFTDAEAIVDAWMGSSSHRANLLDKNFKEIGVAVDSGRLTGREGVLVVQLFGATGQQLTIDNSQLTGKTAGENQQAVLVPSSQATVLASRQFAISKGVSLALVGFIFALFVLETLVLIRRAREHLGGGVLAHVAILGFLLLAVWYSVSGAII